MKLLTQLRLRGVSEFLCLFRLRLSSRFLASDSPERCFFMTLVSGAMGKPEKAEH